MNIVSRSRTGSRSSSRSLNRNLDKPLGHYCTRWLGNARRPNFFATALAGLNQIVRTHRRWIKEMPEYFDPAAVAQRQRDQERERWLKEEVQPALDRIYARDWN
jgi:hypothetical protein